MKIHLLLVLISISISLKAQTPNSVSIPYGNNPATGSYVNVGDAKLYYEIYGKGKPIVLLHGGVFGGIDEFQPFIEKLSQNFQVICIATRGHGKSGVGSATTPVTWEQRSNDAYTVIRSITKDSVMVLGFSDGAYAGLKLAATHPELVKKLIAIGCGDRPKNRKAVSKDFTPELLLSNAKEYFEARLKIMPEPKRWGETVTKLNYLYDKDYISVETFSKISCPSLIMSGDDDTNNPIESATVVHRAIKGSNLSIIPACGHVVFYCSFPAVWEAIAPFIKG